MDAELSRDELEKFPPELRTIAQRFGPELLQFCLTVAGTNRAVDAMLALGERFVAAREPGLVLLNNMATLCELILEAKGWDMDQVTECIQDIGRVQAISACRPKILLN